jgi:hypothetical protein
MFKPNDLNLFPQTKNQQVAGDLSGLNNVFNNVEPTTGLEAATYITNEVTFYKFKSSYPT